MKAQDRGDAGHHAYYTNSALALDLAPSRPPATTKTGQAPSRRLELLTPVAKAWCTDHRRRGIASLGVQVHGGMGFIEETGAAQHLRDSRINPIYEGTNGIQAIDLVARKLPQEGGETMQRYIASLGELAKQLTSSETLAPLGAALAEAVTDLVAATAHLASLLRAKDDAALAAATPYLHLFGLTAGAAGLARGALVVSRRNQTAGDELRIALASYFAANHLPHTGALRAVVTGGGDSLMSISPDQLAAN